MRLQGVVASLFMLGLGLAHAAEYEMVVYNAPQLKGAETLAVFDTGGALKQGDSIVKVTFSASKGSGPLLVATAKDRQGMLLANKGIYGYNGVVMLKSGKAPGGAASAVLKQYVPSQTMQSFKTEEAGNVFTSILGALPWQWIIFGALLAFGGAVYFMKGGRQAPVARTAYSGRRGIEEAIRDIRNRLEQIDTNQKDLVKKPPVLRTFRDQIDGFDQRLKKLEASATASQRSVLGVASSVTGLKTQLTAVTDEASRSEALIRSNNELVSRLGQEVAQRLNEIQAEFVELRNAQSALLSVPASVQALEARMSGLATLVDGLKASNSSSEESIKALGNHAAGTQAKLEELAKVVASSAARASGTDETLKALAQHMATFSNRYEAAIAAIKSDLEKLVAADAFLAAEIGSLKAAQVEVMSQVQPVSNALATFSQKGVQHEEIEALRRSIEAELEAKFRTLGHGIEWLGDLLKAGAAQGTATESQLELVDRLDALRAEVASIQGKQEALAQRSPADEQASERQLREMQTAQESLRSLQESMAGLESKLEALPNLEAKLGSLPAVEARLAELEAKSHEAPAPVPAAEPVQPLNAADSGDPSPVVAPAAEYAAPAQETVVPINISIQEMAQAEEVDSEEEPYESPLHEWKHSGLVQLESVLKRHTEHAKPGHPEAEQPADLHLAGPVDEDGAEEELDGSPNRQWLTEGGTSGRTWSIQIPKGTGVKNLEDIKPLMPIETPDITSPVGQMLYLGSQVVYLHGANLRGFWPGREARSASLSSRVPSDSWRLMSYGHRAYCVAEDHVHIVTLPQWRASRFAGTFLNQFHLGKFWMGVFDSHGSLAVQARQPDGEIAGNPMILGGESRKGCLVAGRADDAHVLAASGELFRVEFASAEKIATLEGTPTHLAVSQSQTIALTAKGEATHGWVLGADGKVLREGEFAKAAENLNVVAMGDRLYYIGTDLQVHCINLKKMQEASAIPLDGVQGVRKMIGFQAGTHHHLMLATLEGKGYNGQILLLDPKSGQTTKLCGVSQQGLELIAADGRAVVATSCSFQNIIRIFEPFGAAKAQAKAA